MKINIIQILIIITLTITTHELSLNLKNMHTWIGYSPDCATKCNEIGVTCNIGKEYVCCTKGQCTSKYGF